MWSSAKSVTLSIICTRIVMLLVVACAILLPWLMKGPFFSSGDGYREVYLGAYATPFMAVLYVCCVPAMAALVCLDRLLNNIRKGDVFMDRNVRFLRIISWCCFAVAAVFALAGTFYVLFFAAAIALAFIGLILRVVKNVIQEAVLIKAENDYTI